MLVHASYDREAGLICSANEDYWKGLSKDLSKSDPKAKWKRSQLLRADQQLVNNHVRSKELVAQLRDAIAVVVSDEGVSKPLTVEQKRESVDALDEVALAMGVAAKLRSKWKAYSTKKDAEFINSPDSNRVTDEMTPAGKPITGEILDRVSDDCKYDPARMEDDEDDTKYFARLHMQADPVTNDTQLVLDVTGWVVARPQVEGVAISNHPITNDPFKLSRRSHILWPSAIRFQSITDDSDKDYIVVDSYERDYKLKDDYLPARSPVSRMPVSGEADGYVMPKPILDRPTRIYSEPNAQLRKLRTKRNFDLQVEMGKAMMTLCKQVVAYQEVLQELRELVPTLESFGLEVPSWLTEAKSDNIPAYTIPEAELIANRQDMYRALEVRRKARLSAYYSAGKR